MSEEKKLETKNETADASSIKVETEKKKSKLMPLLVLVLGCFLLVAVVLIFLHSQEMDKQVLVLKKQIETLKTGEKEVGQRISALEGRLAVMGVKHRLKKITSSRRSLSDLKGMFADNPEMFEKVQGLVDDLQKEQEQLEAEISGSKPITLMHSRSLPAPPCLQGRCEGGRCLLVPEEEPPCLQVIPVPSRAPAGHGPEPGVEKTIGDKAKAQTGWSKFVNMRLFGN